ncbi:MAG: LacI family transcriptional regulator [Spirochaetia bacterium]|nr:LacI family transcriptional regulator [Spirochaetia bacterium]
MADTPTIYDVAKLAGTSIATVSRFLNTPNRVAEKTRKTIQQAMRDLSFVPRADAVARARSGIQRIGVITPFFTAPSFVQRLRGIHEALAQTHFDLITYAVDTFEQLRNYLSVLPVTGRIDGLIIMSLPFTEEDVERFIQHHLPVVSLEFGHPQFSSIEIDNVHGGAMAAEFLIRKGYTKLAFFGEGGQPAYSLHATEERLSGFKSKAEELGVHLQENAVFFHEYGMKFAMDCAVEMLRAKDRPHAVFCASDLQAVGVLKAARSLGLRVPDDIAVMGFDDIDAADYVELTTIRQSLDHSGHLAALKLLDHMNNLQTPSAKVHLNLQIIERQTTRN